MPRCVLCVSVVFYFKHNLKAFSLLYPFNLIYKNLPGGFYWDYDLAGNRTFQDFDGPLTYYRFDVSNALVDEVTDGQFSYYHYDSRGNCTILQETDGSIYFQYNHANLVTSIKYKSGTENFFYYDALLRRYALEDSTPVADLCYKSFFSSSSSKYNSAKKNYSKLRKKTFKK